MKKRGLIAVILIMSFGVINVYAEIFTNNNYMSWQLNKNGNRLNSGNNPFYTSVDNLTDYGNYDLYLFYNNYTAYNNYFYDVTLTIYYDNPFIFANRVRECNIYVEGSSNQKSDGCRVVDFTNNSLTIANYNIQTLTGTGTFTSQFITPVYQNNEITVFQVNSFKLDIVAKEDKSITSETFGNAITNIIDNQNNNANSIINNQNANSQAEIQNANENTDKTINSQKVCNVYDKNSIYRDNTRLQGNGNNITDNDFGTTDYISINEETDIKLLVNYPSTIVRLCFYNINKTFVSCISQSDINVGDYVTIPNNASYMKFSINKASNAPQYQICKNGNQAMSDSLNDLYNKDIDDNYKQLPDTSNFEDYKDAEDSLFDSLGDIDLSVVDVSLDSDSSTWIWNTVTSLIETHTMIFSMFISILSIGIIKMVLGR